MQLKRWPDVDVEFYFADEGDQHQCATCEGRVMLLHFTDIGNHDHEVIQRMMADGLMTRDGEFWQCLNCTTDGMFLAGQAIGVRETMRMILGGGMT